MARNVLVTGVSRYLPGRCARAISAVPGVERVVGVDLVPPREPLNDVEFLRVDIRHPLIGRVIAEHGIDTVLHLGVIATPTQLGDLGHGSRASMKEINVIGTMQLLAACQKSAAVRRVVVKSTAGVYGSHASDPAMFSEDTAGRNPPRTGWGKDTVEVEGYVRGFSRRRPDVSLAMLRFANILGPGMHTALSDYIELPAPPVVAGYDARVQLVHEQDAIDALVLAMGSEVTGPVNVAGHGALFLRQLLAMAGRVPIEVPGPLMGPATRALRALTGVRLGPDETDFLRHGRVLDTARMRTDLGFTPRWTTRDTLADYLHRRDIDGYHGFAAHPGPRLVKPDDGWVA